MRFLFIIISLLIISSEFYSQEVNVYFRYRGKQIELDDDFRVYFVYGDTSHLVVIKPKVKGNKFEFPEINSEYYRILFEYKGKVYSVGKVSYQINQDMEWFFGFDKIPFKEEFNLEEVITKETKGIFYLKLQPLEHGDGVVTSILFEDENDYLEFGRYLIYKW